MKVAGLIGDKSSVHPEEVILWLLIYLIRIVTLNLLLKYSDPDIDIILLGKVKHKLVLVIIVEDDQLRVVVFVTFVPGRAPVCLVTVVVFLNMKLIIMQTSELIPCNMILYDVPTHLHTAEERPEVSHTRSSTHSPSRRRYHQQVYHWA